jgi:protein TonB
MFIDRLNQERHKLSSLGSLLLVFVVFNLAQTLKTPAENLAQEAMELTTTLIEPLLKPPPQLPPPPVRQPEVKPKVVTSTVSHAEPMKEVSTPEPNRASTPIAQPVTQPMAPAPVQSVEAPKMQPPAAVAVSLENNYIASVRATLNANKRYPTGREASLQRPSGKVKVWFVLLRNGSLQEAGIDESSNSIILDNAALSTVRRTAYAPWPESTWPNLAQHKFTVTLDFVPLN